MVDVDVRVSSNLKEELTWAIDKRLWVISTIIIGVAGGGARGAIAPPLFQK